MVGLLLVEDDPGIRTTLTRALTQLGHAVTAVSSAAEAITNIASNPPDLMVLDLGLPDLDGREVLRVARAISPLPVIIATARDDDAETIRLLDAGADDYLVKPFSAVQLDARIRAVLRRVAPAPDSDPVLRVGGLELDPVGRTAALDGVELVLTRKEFDLLQALMQRPGEVVSKRRLLAEVWQQAWGGADRTVDVHLSWLRRKLGETAANPRYLVSVRGVGVKIVDPGETS